MTDTTIALQPQISQTPFTQEMPRKPYLGPQPIVLLVLDGWGIGPNNAGNAIAKAKTPNLNKYWLSYPHTQLAASGVAVGLPQGEDGNTETGHLNMGAGCIVYQDLPRINMAIADGSFAENSEFLAAVAHVKQHNSTLHLMGLVGSGGVHSNIEHLHALLNFCRQQQLTKVYLHCFLDGRDSPPTAGIEYIRELLNRCQEFGVGEIATVVGRYYAMDRDRRWERIEKAYNTLTLGAGKPTTDPLAEIQAQYDKNITDEFLEPIVVQDAQGQLKTINDNDAVIFYNYRIDRPRELTRAFVQPNFESGIQTESFDPYAVKYAHSHLKSVGGLGTSTFTRQKILKNLFFITMTRYEENLPVHVAFPPQFVQDPLGKVFAQNGLRQLRMAETEKEKFVTYYMNGQQDVIFPGEDRVILPSKGSKSYDQTPEMSANEITDEMIKRIQQNQYDVILCNLANADMVAHTGNFQATVKACEILDVAVGKIVDEVVNHGGIVLITADHGNAEELLNSQTGQVDTEHSTNPVPFIMVGQQFAGQTTTLPQGILADIAPTILKLMKIESPKSMTGRSLV